VRTLVAPVLLAALASALASAPALRAQDPEELRLRRVDARLGAEFDVEVVQGRLVSRTGRDLARVAAECAGASCEPLVRDVPRAQLDAWYAHACEVLPAGRRPGHLGHWIRLTAPTADAAKQLLAALQSDPAVDCAYAEPVVKPAWVDDPAPPTPLFTSLQTNMGPSPTGLGIWQGQGVLGARGQGVHVVMIEDDWILGHEDVSKLVASAFLGAVPLQTGSTNQHGLSGTSILCADRNAWGITGIADEIDIRFASREYGYTLENAIAVTTANTQPGDVLMMVLMLLIAQVGNDDWVPVEYLQATFDAVLTATANGRLFVAAGGNGGRSLDDPRLLNRFNRGFRDSGAIIVAASEGASLQRPVWCNYGSRMDANGWGDNVVCCGYGTIFFPNADVRQAYTASGTGTSSATPQVAGVVCSVQGAALRQLGRRLTNAEMLSVLHQYGTPSPDTIGRRPDLLAMLTAIGAVDGLLPAAPDVQIGGSVSVAMSGAGAGAFLFASFGVGDLDLGFNRHFHLDLASMLTIGFFGFAGGQASLQVTVPPSPDLHGVSLYLQAGTLDNGAVHLSNSAQLTVL
jgi:hypothetical protein